jgi:hypothetical protein
MEQSEIRALVARLLIDAASMEKVANAPSKAKVSPIERLAAAQAASTLRKCALVVMACVDKTKSPTETNTERM